ncbi:MAG: sulfurtransferase TusA family protein [Actinomycetota bacterium]|nr:sulfurtransferase TusA family protein [Actinomycetota bacterium]
MYSQEVSIERWDAGELGCGELVVELKRRLSRLPAGAVMELIARDGGVAEDLPAWCRLTAHALVEARPPNYVIRRRKEG